MFSAEDLGQSSSFRELKAIYYVSGERLERRKVKVFTDNQGAARIVSKGSSKVRLQSVAMSIFDFCLSNGISLEAQWILRSQNEKVDLLSRLVDKDDWRINPSVFRLLGAVGWGPHTIDRLSTYYNAQLLRFNSSLPPPDAGAWMPILKAGASKTIVCFPQFILLSTRSVITSLVPDAGP